MILEQSQEVVCLENLVAELGVRQARVGASHPRAHRLLGDHGPDRELLPDVAQEAQDVELAEPGVIVEELRVGRPRAELEEA